MWLKKYVFALVLVSIFFVVVVWQIMATEQQLQQPQKQHQDHNIKSNQKVYKYKPDNLKNILDFYVNYDVVEGNWSGWTEDPQLASLGDDPQYFGLTSKPKIHNICIKVSCFYNKQTQIMNK